MSTFISPESVAIPLSGFSTSGDLDKALVYDSTAGHYVLMSADIAKVEVAIAKRSARKSWAVRATQVMGLCLVSGVLGFIASEMGGDSMRTALKSLTGSTSEVATRSPAPVQTPAMGFAITAPPPVSVTSDSAAPALATGVSAPIPLPQASEAIQAVLVAAATPATPPASPPIAMASAVTPTPVAVQVARFPIAATSAPVVAQPVVKASPPPPTVTTPVAKPVERPKPASPKEVAKSTPPATKVTKVVTVQATPTAPKVVPPAEVPPTKPVQVPVGVQRVSAQGVHYFDGSANKLFAVGSTLPNGEKVIDVDEASATYATDKGVRQIRPSKP